MTRGALCLSKVIFICTYMVVCLVGWLPLFSVGLVCMHVYICVYI